MTPISRILIIASLVFCSLPSTSSAQEDESKEPPIKYILKVGDKSVPITEGESAKIEGKFTNPVVSLTAEPHRVFKFQGVTFKYPRSFTFEADLEDENVKNWTLSGNDFEIMYFVATAPLAVDEFVTNMTNQFGEENCKVTDPDAKITLGETELTGKTLEITIATHKIVMDTYHLPSAGERHRLLVFQDSMDEETGEHSQESKDTLDGIKKSFEIE